MQKINIISIVIWHLNTLRDDRNRLVISDLLTFYGIPLLLAVGFFALDWRVPQAAIELSVTVFSVFAALLLSVQVALYSVSLRPLTPPTDQKKRKAFEARAASRNVVIKELNDNIAYLILLAVVWITVLLGLYVLGLHGRGSSAAVFAMFVHFFLTLLMVVKRASIVFSREYEEPVRQIGA